MKKGIQNWMPFGFLAVSPAGCRGDSYQLSEPWQEFEEQVRVDAFQPVLLITFLVPLLCVAVFTVVLLKPLPWQEEQERLLCLE